jgi:hypothetical protein
MEQNFKKDAMKQLPSGGEGGRQNWEKFVKALKRDLTKF